MHIRLGTRASQMALAQAHIVKDALIEKSLATNQALTVEICPIMTTGDKDLTTPLYELGGKGVFIKELEKALLDNTIDIAVHSLKDMTSVLAPGLHLISFLAAKTARDALILKAPYHHLAELPSGATIATGSLRRKAILKKMRPDIKTIDIRGNVITRLEKLKTGDFHGLLLSEAGLIRLNLCDMITECFAPKLFCPAPGQGVIAIETRKNDEHVNALCLSITDAQQTIKSTTELAFLETVGLDCKAPLGAHAVIVDNTIAFQAFVADASATHFFEKNAVFSLEDRLVKARALAQEFLTWMQGK